jgi:hypothetical protein
MLSTYQKQCRRQAWWWTLTDPSTPEDEAGRSRIWASLDYIASSGLASASKQDRLQTQTKTNQIEKKKKSNVSCVLNEPGKCVW